MEVGDDQLAVRQVDVFESSRVLRYDRDHKCDDYGMLIGLKIQPETEMGEVLSRMQS